MWTRFTGDAAFNNMRLSKAKNHRVFFYRYARPRSNPAGILFLCAALFCVVFIMPSHSDRITFRNGDHLRGVFININDYEIEFRTLTGRVTIPRSKVSQYETDTLAENNFIKLQISLRSGTLEEIEQALTEYSKQALGAERSWREILLHQDNLLHTVSGADEKQREAFLKTFSAQFQDSDNSDEVQWLTYRVLLAMQKQEDADTVLFKIPLQYIRHLLEFGGPGTGLIAELQRYRERVLKLIMGRDLVGAGKILAWLSEVQPEESRSLYGLLDVRFALKYFSEGKYHEGLKVYSNSLAQRFPQTSRLLLKRHVPKLMQQFQDAREWDKARELLDDFAGFLPEVEVNDLRHKFYMAWGDVLLDAGEFEQSREKFNLANELLAGSANRSLRTVNWLEASRKIDPEDSQAKLDHARVAIREGLYPQAREALIAVRKFKPLVDAANEEIYRLNTAEAQDLYNQARQAYYENRFHRALDLIEEIQTEYPSSGIREQVNDFEKIVQNSMHKPPVKKEYPLSAVAELEEQDLDYTINPMGKLEIMVPQEAEWIYEYQAEVLLEEIVQLNREKQFEQALDALETLLANYSTSTFAELGHDLHDEILSGWMIDVLENSTVSHIPESISLYLPSLEVEIEREHAPLFEELKQMLLLFE